jgi:hypothetical protein
MKLPQFPNSPAAKPASPADPAAVIRAGLFDQIIKPLCVRRPCFVPWSASLLLVLMVLVVYGHPAAGQQAPLDYFSSQLITAETADGQLPCNTSAAFAQLPGQTDMFIGRGFGPGSLAYCHNPGPGSQGAFLALFRMDWDKHKMTLVNYLFRPQKPPVREPAGVWSAYDPYAASYNGKVWVAFECAVAGMGTASSCVAPMAPDLGHLDLSRLTVLAQGNTQKSASTPVLLNFLNRLYVYWTINHEQNQLPANVLITRGMPLEEDSHGRLWGAGSEGRPVMTDDTNRTTLVGDVIPSDPTANHVAHLRSVLAVGTKILAISTLGGTAGQQVCASSHQLSPGCWRMSLSIADAPLGENVFRKKVVELPSLPGNVVEYPRVIVDPGGRKLLMGQFLPPKVSGPTNARPQVLAGVRYLSFDYIIEEALRAQ